MRFAGYQADWYLEINANWREVWWKMLKVGEPLKSPRCIAIGAGSIGSYSPRISCINDAAPLAIKFVTEMER